MAKVYNDEQVARAQTKLAKFISFKEANGGRGGAWEFMERRARELYEKGQRISGRALVEEARKHAGDFTTTDGGPCQLDNDFAAPVSRTLLAEHPEYRAFVEMRETAFDLIMA